MNDFYAMETPLSVRHQHLGEEYSLREATRATRGVFDGIAAAVSGSPFNADNTTLIVDVSKWVPVADVALLKAAGVRGIIARIGEGLNDEADPTWAYYVQEAYNNDMPCMGYYVIHPEYIDNAPGNVAEHLKRIKKHVANKAIQGIWIDAEITKDLNGNKLASNWISERTRSLLDETKRAFPNLVVGLYTGGWYVDGYSPQMKTWIYKYPLWWAWYTQPVGQRISIEWDALKNYYPTRTPTNLPPNASGDGAATMNLFQWSGDHFLLPGMYSREDKSLRAAADVNFFMGGERAWYEFAKFTPRGTGEPSDPGEPEIPPPPVTGDFTAVLTELAKISADVKSMRAKLDAIFK